MNNGLGNKKIFAQNLKAFMDQYGYTSKDIAEKIGVKPSAVSYWINATYYPRIDKIEMLANLFHVNKSTLVEDPKANLVNKWRNVSVAEEKSLLTAWSKASPEDRFAVYAILRKYGMPEPSSEDTTSAVS